MGPMVRGPGFNRRRITKLAAVGIIAMFTWSLIAAPSSVGQDAEIAEPETISSYYTFADAAPISGYLDHQALPAPAFGSALAHSHADVGLPSEASAIAWLLDAGIANGLHGTTTGASVPTEVTAKQPGGEPSAEFTTAGGPIGEDEFGRAAVGVARARATQSESPRGFAHAYFNNICLFPAAGSPPEPPGTYDPDATFPGGDNQKPIPDPGPLAQQCIVGVSSMSSTSQSIREGDTVTSIAVAELQGITIGDRTSDNRCTNCFYIDAIRVESYARSNGTPEGVRAGYRVLLGRACRRTFEPSVVNTVEDTVTSATGGTPEEVPAKEVDQCVGPTFPEEYTLTELEQLNEQFDEPLVLPGLECNGAPCTIAVRIEAGKRGHADPIRAQRVTDPPDDPCRNYAYPDASKGAKPIEVCQNQRVKTGPDRDQGQEAKAVAEGIDIDILTLTGTQFIPTNEDLDSCFESVLPPLPDPIASAVGTVKDTVGCPIATARQVRDLNLTLGVAQAGAVARPNVIIPPIDGGDGGVLPPIGGDFLP
ncbi:MAG: hypothetical protein ACRDKS_01570, partial [Actinomycetota bacterium]